MFPPWLYGSLHLARTFTRTIVSSASPVVLLIFVVIAPDRFGRFSAYKELTAERLPC